MTPSPDPRVCAWCGKTISATSGVKLHPPTMAFDAAEWFCDWACEAHAVATSDTSTRRKHGRGTSVTRSA